MKKKKNENFVDVDDVDARGVPPHRNRPTVEGVPNRTPHSAPSQVGSLSIRGCCLGVLTVWGVRYRRYRTPHTVGRITATDDPQHESQEIISGRLKKRNFVNVVWRACFYPFSTDRKAPRTGQRSAKSEHFCLGKLTKKKENAHFGKKRPVLTSPHKIVRRPFWCWSGAPFAGGGRKKPRKLCIEARQGKAMRGKARRGKARSVGRFGPLFCES